jgi:hypothetical protein
MGMHAREVDRVPQSESVNRYTVHLKTVKWGIFELLNI